MPVYETDPFVGGASLRRHALCAGVWRDWFRRILRGMHHLAMIVGKPLRIVREFGEASLEPLKLTNFVRPVRYPANRHIHSPWRDIAQR